MSEDMLHTCVIVYGGSLVEHLNLIKSLLIAIATTLESGMAPFEDLYGRRCRFPIGWFVVGKAEIFVLDLLHQDIDKV